MKNIKRLSKLPWKKLSDHFEVKEIIKPFVMIPATLINWQIESQVP
jgi:hypothetical protein